MAYMPHLVRGDQRGISQKVSHKTLAPGNLNKNRKKPPALRFASWNVRAKCQQINDARKTAVIDKELSRLQETRLADDGIIREANYTIYWQGKPTDQPRQHGVGFAVKNTLISSTEPPTAGTDRLLLFGCQCPLVQSASYVCTPPPSALLRRRRISFTKPWMKQYPGYPAPMASTSAETSTQSGSGPRCLIHLSWKLWEGKDT
jgi:hypothetical protein